MELPDLQEGLDSFLTNIDPSLTVVAENYVPSKELARQAAESAPDITPVATIRKIQQDIEHKFSDGSRMGSLLATYHLNRDAQMQTLMGLGKDVLLSIVAQGILPATIAKEIGVSYDTFVEYLRITATKEEIKHADELAADALVAEGLSELHNARDSEDVTRAKAIMETHLKLAKAKSAHYSEKMPKTAVQINNYQGSDEKPQSFVAMPQMTVPDVENLPPLEEHSYQSTTSLHEEFAPEGYVDGEFSILNGEDLD